MAPVSFPLEHDSEEQRSSRPHVLEETKLIRTPELNALVRMCRRKDGIGARCAALHSAPPAAAHPSPLRTATET